MRKQNDAICSFLLSTDRFADFINCVGFRGKGEVHPKELESYDSSSVEHLVDRNKNTIYIDRYRDLIAYSGKSAHPFLWNGALFR